MSTSSPNESAAPRLGSLSKWRARLAPIALILTLGVFLYWVWTYRLLIEATLKRAGLATIAIMLPLLLGSLFLTVLAFCLLVRAKGYAFSLSDAYHSLNISQLASMIPGGIWGYAGLAGVLWTKRISKPDSLIIILVYTLIMLSACAMVGIAGLASLLGWVYALFSLIPLLVLLIGWRGLDRLRERHLPGTSPLPSRDRLLQALGLGLVVWILSGAAFAVLLRASVGAPGIPFWTAAGAYAAGYVGGYISVFAPSGLGVSEGLIALLLGSSIGTERALAIAISFRIIQTVWVWCNILVTVLLKAGVPESRPA